MTGDPDLFGPDAGRPEPGPLDCAPDAPLAARMRPLSLDDFLGQSELVGAAGALRALIERDRVPSLILWGPPGCGKTTLAGIIARHTGARFEPFSAVTEGIGRVRELISQASERRRATGRCDLSRAAHGLARRSASLGTLCAVADGSSLRDVADGDSRR